MLKCFIIDDDPSSISLLSQYIIQTEGLDNGGSTHSAQEAVHKLQNLGSTIDVIFLNTDMAGLSTLDILDKLTRLYSVILVSGNHLHAEEAFVKGVSGYLLKPVQYDRFYVTVKKVKEIVTSRENKIKLNPVHIFVPGNGREVRVRISTADICYIQSSTNFCTIFLDQSNVFCSISLKQLCTVLQPPYFVRVNRSVIVNSSKIIQYDAYDVFLDGNKVFPFGEKYRGDFVRIMRSTGLVF